MRRALSVAAAALLFAGCEGLSLEGDAARPFACTPNAPADAGKQCSDGWSCGFDQRCFLRAGAHAAESWRCESDEQCPDAWRCGAEVGGVRACQRLGVGAPSPCNAADDCQGGWRCAFEQVCFDPADAGNGRARRCTADEALQCPLDFRCGEPVPADGGVAWCLLLDAGTDAPCTSDRGCEGGWRCDLHAHTCVEVADVVTVGPSTSFTAAKISPMATLPVPSHLSVSRLVDVPGELLGGGPGVVRAGFLSAAAYDGGVLVVSQTLDRNRLPDGGQDVVRTRLLPLTRGGLDELVVAPAGVLARFADDTVQLLHFDGGVVEAGRASGVRGGDFVERGLFGRELLRLDGGQLVLADGSRLPPLPPRTMGPPPAVLDVFTGGGEQLEVFALAADGVVHALQLDAGPTWEPRTFTQPVRKVRSASVGRIDAQRLGVILEVESFDAGVRLQPILPAGPLGGLQADDFQTFAPCPGGAELLQTAFERAGGNNWAAAVRCRLGDGGVFTALSRFNFTGASSGQGDRPVFTQIFEQAPDDPGPYVGPIVNARGAPLVRAHAGANGRLWYTDGLDAGALPGLAPLRPLLLDRAPDSIVEVPMLGLGLVAGGGGYQYELDDELGFVSSFSGGQFVILDTFRNEPSWIITSDGAFDLSGVATGSVPRVFMVLANPQSRLSAPVSAFSERLVLGGSERRVVLLSAGDALWASDVTQAIANPFAPQATLEPVFVPMPGVRLRSLTLVDADAGVSGFITTSTSVIEFATDDLVQWETSTVPAPAAAALPVEVWTERGRGRVGTRDGRVWSLPIMVPLTAPLRSAGTQLSVDDFARRCDAVFATTREGLFALHAADAGLPDWAPVAPVNAQLESRSGLRLYETRDQTRLFVSTPRGQIVEVLGGACP